MQVIIYKNDTGNVSVCYPSGETSIEEVLKKDCPTGAIIINSSELPQELNDASFNSWKLVDGDVVVTLTT